MAVSLPRDGAPAVDRSRPPSTLWLKEPAHFLRACSSRRVSGWVWLGVPPDLTPRLRPSGRCADAALVAGVPSPGHAFKRTSREPRRAP